MNNLTVVLSFLISMGLVFISDLPLNGMLGMHPLQSELTFVESHVDKVQKEQKGVEVQEVPKGLSELEAMVLTGLCLFILLSAVIGFLVWQLRCSRRCKAEPEREHAPKYSGVAWMMGAFFLICGVVYSVEGSKNLEEHEDLRAEFLLKRKQGRIFTKLETRQEEVLMYVNRLDENRQTLGFTMLAFGFLVCSGGFGMMYWERRAT
jgi:p-aminobenzoyl-glutamate transporter AbgT